jgi:hypothetical protein
MVRPEAEIDADVEQQGQSNPHCGPQKGFPDKEGVSPSVEHPEVERQHRQNE